MRFATLHALTRSVSAVARNLQDDNELRLNDAVSAWRHGRLNCMDRCSHVLVSSIDGVVRREMFSRRERASSGSAG